MKSRLMTPATTLKVSVRPEPTRPNTPVIWPGEHRQRVVLHHRRHAQILHRQHALPCGRTAGLALAVQRLRQVAADHRLNDARAIEIRRLSIGHDMLAVAQDGDAVGDLQRLLERVRDEDHRHAALLSS